MYKYREFKVGNNLNSQIILPIHEFNGTKEGLVLGITCTVHGDETFPAFFLKNFFEKLKEIKFEGKIIATSVANSLAMSSFSRQTPEQHGKTDLHEVFPGSSSGNLTQRMAHVIKENILDKADVVIDYHCGGSGGRLQDRVDINSLESEEVKKKSLELARSFGTFFIHENNLKGSAVNYANSLNKIAFNAETGGVYLSKLDRDYYLENAISGMINVMRKLNMLEGSFENPKQILFDTNARKEINPNFSGFLVSNFESHKDIGKLIKKGEILGYVFDMYTLQNVQNLVAPIDGYLFFTRYSGVLDIGTKAYAIADKSLIKEL